jgi:hypothetical protein
LVFVDPMEKQLKEVGLQLKKLRHEAGFSSYADFAWEYNLNKSQYWRMENGTNCTFKSLQKVLDIHGLSFQQFFALVEKLT